MSDYVHGTDPVTGRGTPDNPFQAREEYLRARQESTFRNCLKYADLVTGEQLNCEVEHGNLTHDQRRQVWERQAELRAAAAERAVDGDEDGT